MREGKFLKQNMDRWQTYMDATDDPDTQANQFVNLIDDLAYSKTFYPKSTTTQFINGLAAKLFNSIYRNRKVKSNRVAIFFKFELPYIFSKYQKLYFFTIIFFVACVAFGAISNATNPDFVREILGNGYVDKTEENIANGDPFGVYKESKPFAMFMQIGINNIYVSFQVFIMGIFVGIGTLYYLFTNGVMLGAFEQMFFAKGVGINSILVVWLHGTIEISAIVIAGLAGLILGTSFLFPGTYSRMQSFLLGARDAVKIIVALIPFFVVAAFIESYITRLGYMDNGKGMSPILSLLIIGASLFVMVGYFIVYPNLLKKGGITVVGGEVYINGILKSEVA
jgi:uncharacterized membrane protein SpoIIM required for sporulation